MAERLKVAVLFGGRSGEHEVSIMSARSVMRALDPAKYEVIPVLPMARCFPNQSTGSCT